MTAGMPETVFKTDHQRVYLLSWNANNLMKIYITKPRPKRHFSCFDVWSKNWLKSSI